MGRDLYVGNIPFEATEDDLRNLFSVAGEVKSIHLVTDARSGQFKGCGFVKMANAAQAKDAINCLDGALLENRPIVVSEARPQKPPESASEVEPAKPRRAKKPGRRRR
ncbi:RNA-binding protein [uncultured Desulfuromonas sp.]|uniref:RNA recognition motif domain-containing protein n=1 Tax=uncultured Desulfuromonas sp. TaxID=181013 RepID=UPI00260D6259|nr:RNA-binding protein [uncultured Desulfuromonas sp.]